MHTSHIAIELHTLCIKINVSAHVTLCISKHIVLIIDHLVIYSNIIIVQV